MSQTTQMILPWLQLAAGSGAGIVASWLFSRLRDAFPQSEAPSWVASLLYAPRYARLSSIVLASLVSVVSSLLVAWLSRGSLPEAFDAAVAAALAGLASQLTHAATLKTEVPVSAAEASPAPSSQVEPEVHVRVAQQAVLDEPGMGSGILPAPDRRVGSRAVAFRSRLPDAPEEENS